MAAQKKLQLGVPYPLDMDPTEWRELSTTDRPQIEKHAREQVRSRQDDATCSRCGQPKREDETWAFVFSPYKPVFYLHHPHCAMPAQKKILAAAARKLRQESAAV